MIYKLKNSSKLEFQIEPLPGVPLSPGFPSFPFSPSMPGSPGSPGGPIVQLQPAIKICKFVYYQLQIIRIISTGFLFVYSQSVIFVCFSTNLCEE